MARRALLAPALALFAGSARAAAPALEPQAAARQACVEAFERGQDRRNAGRLLAAKDDFTICAREGCIEAVRGRCASWLEELERELPTVLVTAVRPATEVRVIVDGVLVASSPAGPIALDPGEHLVRLEHAGAPPIERRIVLGRGEKNRVLEVRFEPPPPAPRADAPPPLTPPAPSSEAPAPEPSAAEPVAIAGFSLAAAGLLAGAVTGVVAAVRTDELAEQCATRGCTEDELDGARTLAHVSTGGFVVAGAGLAVGVGALLAERFGSEQGPDLASPVLTYVSLGVAAGGLCTTAVAGGIALARRDELEAECAATGCTEAQLDDVRTAARVSMVGLALGGAGLGALVASLLVVPARRASGSTIDPALGPGLVGARGRF
jgi:hypothetical protein